MFPSRITDYLYFLVKVLLGYINMCPFIRKIVLSIQQRVMRRNWCELIELILWLIWRLQTLILLGSTRHEGSNCFVTVLETGGLFFPLTLGISYVFGFKLSYLYSYVNNAVWRCKELNGTGTVLFPHCRSSLFFFF